jgi:hypothetical protein
VKDRPFESWEDVLAFALTLGDAEQSTSYGRPAIRVRGKAFVYAGREAGSFAIACRIEDKELLIETDPETFWETDHYRGWPAVLVRFGRPDRERIERVIERAWWDRSSKKQRLAFGERP